MRFEIAQIVLEKLAQGGGRWPLYWCRAGGRYRRLRFVDEDWRLILQMSKYSMQAVLEKARCP